MTPLEGESALGGNLDWIDLNPHELVVAAIATPTSRTRLLELAGSQIAAAKELGDTSEVISYTNAKFTLKGLIDKSV